MTSQRTEVWGFEVGVPEGFHVVKPNAEDWSLPNAPIDEVVWSNATQRYDHCFAVMRGLEAELIGLSSGPSSMYLRSDGKRFFQILCVVPSYSWASQIIQDEILDWCHARYAAADKILGIHLDFLFVCDDKEIDYPYLIKEGFFIRYGDNSI